MILNNYSNFNYQHSNFNKYCLSQLLSIKNPKQPDIICKAFETPRNKANEDCYSVKIISVLLAYTLTKPTGNVPPEFKKFNIQIAY